MNRNIFYKELYSNNVFVIKKYRNKFKLILFKSLINSGVDLSLNKSDKSTVNTSKLNNNLSRAKSNVYELAVCNDWEYFVTLTINGAKYNRENLKEYYKDFSKFLNNYNFQNKCNIKYLFIPELHKDGKSWHMHGLMFNIPENKLSINNNGYLDWKDYKNRFGYISMSKIKDIERTALYITKYITKSTEKSKIELGNHLYYCSKNLKRAEKLFKGHIYGISPDFNYDFNNDYLSVKTVSETEIEEIIKECEFFKL